MTIDIRQIDYDKLPKNFEAEQAVLGGVLIDGHAIESVADFLKPDHFYMRPNQLIYKTMIALYGAGIAIDLVTLSEALGEEKLAEVGDVLYLTSLSQTTPTSMNTRHYGEIVYRLALKRMLITLLGRGVDRALDDREDAPEAITWLEQELFNLTNDYQRKDFESMKSIMERTLERISHLREVGTELTGLSTGFIELDKYTHGFQRKDLIYLAARPSQGKAQPLNAKALTISGWKLVGDLSIGDQLASIDGEPSVVSGVFSQGIKEIYRIVFSDGRATRCCADHLWKVHYKGWADKTRILSTKEIVQLLKKPHLQRRLYIDTFSGEFGNETKLPLHPWVLGALLGNGQLKNLRFSSADKETLEKLNNLLAQEGDGYVLNHKGKYDYQIKRKGGCNRLGHSGVLPNEVKDVVRNLGLGYLKSPEKYIPAIYKTANKEARLQLLQGLLDTDGWKAGERGLCFGTTSPQLARDVVYLARSLGAQCRLNPSKFTKKPTREGGFIPAHRCYTVTIMHPNAGLFVSLKRKKPDPKIRQGRLSFKSIKLDSKEPAQCISVTHPSGLYITDDFTVTHNTALALNTSWKLASKGIPVGFFSLEMSADQLGDRVLSLDAFVNSSNLRSGKMLETEWIKTSDHIGKIAGLPIYVDESKVSIAELRSKAKRLQMRENIQIIFVDYIQLMLGERAQNESQELSVISRGLKSLAKELNVPVVVISQLNRSPEGRKEHIPELSDLRGSGSLEQDADLVLMLYRKGFYEPEAKDANTATVIIAKHRNGETGQFRLQWNGEQMRFNDLYLGAEW